MTPPDHIRALTARELACALVAHRLYDWAEAFMVADMAPKIAAGHVWRAMRRKVKQCQS